jgi:hypothetical protein
MSESDDDFLSRWSRRKSGSRDGGLQKKQEEPVHKAGRMRTDPPAPKEAAPVAELDGEAPLSQEASLQPEQPIAAVEEPAVEEADEKTEPVDYEKFDFDKLNYASDYTQFLKEDVPEAVKRRALRMLWGSNPILANLDGLNDYDEDFTDAALAVKVLSSNYKPGSGYLTEEERIASYSEEARLAGPEPVEDDVEESDIEDMDDDEDVSEDVQTVSAEGGDLAEDENASDKNEPA